MPFAVSLPLLPISFDFHGSGIGAFLGKVIGAQKSRTILWAPVFFGLGIGVYFSLPFEPGAGGSVLLCLTLLGFFIASWLVWEKFAAGSFMLLFSGAALLVGAGFAAAQVRTALAYTPMLQKSISYAEVTGRIGSLEILPEGEGTRVVLTDVASDKFEDGRAPRKIRLVLRKDGGVQPGDFIRVAGALNPPSAPVAPGAFDFQRYAYFRGIGAVGFAYKEPEILEKAKGMHAPMQRLQVTMSRIIEENLRHPEAAFAMTLMTGQARTISEEDYEAMRDAGLAHLLSISGMHVGMVTGILFFLSRLVMALFPAFALRRPIKKYAAAFALGGAVFYTFLVGAPVPTLRALFMSALFLLAIMADRSPLSLRVVCLAAFAVLLFSPESLMNVSFQMSFAAVIALISFYDAMREKWAGLYADAGVIRRVALYLGGILLTTLIAEAAITPFALYHFQHHASYSLIGNFLAVPITGIIVMPALVAAAMAMPFGLAYFPLWVAGKGLGALIAVAHWTSGLEGAVLNPPAIQPLCLLMAVTGGLFLCLGRGWLRALGFPFFLLAVFFALTSRVPDILVSAKAEVIAMRMADQRLWVSNRRKDKFTTENWMRMNGQNEEIPDVFPREGTAGYPPLSCDREGCRVEKGGKKIAMSYSQRGWQEDCRWADIILSAVPVQEKGCAAPLVIDRFSVWENGAYALYLAGEEEVEVRSVRGMRGDRPWTSSAPDQ